MQYCTRCEGTGFLNIEQIPEDTIDLDDTDAVLKWIDENDEHDVGVCDCCGDGEGWYDEPGCHTPDGLRAGDPFECR